MTLANVVHRIATDPTFAPQLVEDAQKALVDADLVLDAESMEGLLAVLRSDPNWMELCSPAMNGPEEFPWTG